MARYFIALFLIAAVIVSCQQKQKSVAREYLNESKLTAQSFTIDPTKDTLLISQSGIRIKIEKETFSGTQQVQIDFKEALDFESIIQAGLFTMSADKMLSSAGMFYFNTQGNLPINKPIGIEVPAKTALEGMKLFKGDEIDGKINWEDPKPIAVAPANMLGVDGKAIFLANCASCHRIDQKLTGPALAGVTERWRKRWDKNIQFLGALNLENRPNYDSLFRSYSPLFDYTRDPISYMTENIDAPYICCLKNKANGAMMSAFPGLNDTTLAAIYKYIDDETERLGLDPKQYETGCDSCMVNQLEQWPPIIATDTAANPVSQHENASENSVPYVQEAVAVPKDADYYQLSIESNGWFNIDIFLGERENVSESKLMVNLRGGYEGKVQVFLAIPSFKVLMEGRNPEAGKEVVFKYDDGSMPLPQNVEALIFVMGEEKGKFYFAKRWFNTKTSQTIDVGVETMTKAEFGMELRRIQQRGWTFSVDSSDNNGAINIQDSVLRETEKLNPRAKPGRQGCDCWTGADTAVVVYDYMENMKEAQ